MKRLNLSDRWFDALFRKPIFDDNNNKFSFVHNSIAFIHSWKGFLKLIKKYWRKKHVTTQNLQTTVEGFYEKVFLWKGDLSRALLIWDFFSLFLQHVRGIYEERSRSELPITHDDALPIFAKVFVRYLRALQTNVWHTYLLLFFTFSRGGGRSLAICVRFSWHIKTFSCRRLRCRGRCRRRLELLRSKVQGT